MRLPQIALIALAVLALTQVLLRRDDHFHKMVPPEDFIAMMGGPSGKSRVEFVGTDSLRAYLTYQAMGTLRKDTYDVYSVAIEELPAAERLALRNGQNPWWKLVQTNDPGLRPSEENALKNLSRLPPHGLIVVVLRCASGKPAQVARNHFDNTFTDDTVVSVPVPCSLAIVLTAEEVATLGVGREGQLLRVEVGETIAAWIYIDKPGATEVAVHGTGTTWSATLRGVPAAAFYNSAFEQRRSK
jgi:hypothetical protein